MIARCQLATEQLLSLTVAQCVNAAYVRNWNNRTIHYITTTFLAASKITDIYFSNIIR